MRRPLLLPLAMLMVLLAGCSGGATVSARPAPTLSAGVSPTAGASSATDPSAVPLPPPAPVAPLSWHACDAGFQCATLTTALDEQHPDRGTVGIAVVRHLATGPGTRIGSLIVNPGGPGESAIGFLEGDFGGFPAQVRARFDVVAFDPRGVGRSDPVRCGTTAELDHYFGIDPTPDTPAELTAFEAANTSFVAGCSRRSSRVLPYVSTAVVADDLDRVRAAVGDAKLTYLGYSYGTSIGATYLDRYPTHVRAMVLDGALDPTLTWDQLLAGQAVGFDHAFGSFLADCQQHTCAFRRAVQGDLGTAFDTLVRSVDQHSLPTRDGRPVGAADLFYGVGAGLYSKATGWPAIAAALASAEHGDGSILLALADSYLERSASGYANVNEANVAVNCVDRPWPRDPAAYTAAAARIQHTAPRFGPAIVLSGMTCGDWPVGPFGHPHPVRGVGAPPVVVIGGLRDPATPYVWAQGLVAQLDSAVLITHDGDGHTVYRTGAPACIVNPVDSYLLDLRVPATATC